MGIIPKPGVLPFSETPVHAHEDDNSIKKLKGACQTRHQPEEPCWHAEGHEPAAGFADDC